MPDGAAQQNVVTTKIDLIIKQAQANAVAWQNSLKQLETATVNFSNRSQTASASIVAAIEQNTQAIANQTQLQVAGYQAVQAQMGQYAQASQQAVAQTQKVTGAQQKSAQSLGKSVKAWGKLTLKMVGWAVGAASAYRLFRKGVQFISETTETLFKHTDEWENLKDAQDNFKASLMAAIGTEEEWLRALDNIANAINNISDALIKGRASFELYKAAIPKGEEIARFWHLLGMAIAKTTGNFEAFKEHAEALAALPAGDLIDPMLRGLKAYDSKLKELEKTQRDFKDRITETRKEGEKLTEQQRRYHQYLEKVQNAEMRRIEDIIDLYEEYGQQLEDIEREWQQDLEDLRTEGARRGEDIERDYRRRLEDIERTSNDRRRKIEEAYRIRLIKIEMRYREQLIRIEEDFADAVYDAVSRRDALALVRARRARAKAVGRAERQRRDDTELAKLDYERRLRDLEASLRNEREAAEIARRRALEDLAVYLRRERDDIDRAYNRKLDDLETYLQRQREKIELEYVRATEKANLWYTQDETAYAAHLRRKIAELRNYYLEVARLNNAYFSTILPMSAGAQQQPTAGVGPGLAEGGTFVATSPTSVRVGEKQWEMVTAVPLGPGAMNANISGRMQHQVSGAIQGTMAGLEGRLTVAINDAVLKAFGEIVRQ